MININLENIEFVKEEISKESVLEKFTDMAHKKKVITSKEEFMNGLTTREKEFSTGIGQYVAIPHCKSKAVKEASVFIQKLYSGVEWNSLDGKPVSLAICLAVPEEESGTTHLKLLSKIARSLIDEDIKKRLLNSNDKESLLLEIKNILNN